MTFQDIPGLNSVPSSSAPGAFNCDNVVVSDISVCLPVLEEESCQEMGEEVSQEVESGNLG